MTDQIELDTRLMTRPYPHVYEDLQMTTYAADVVQLDGARVFSVPSSTVDGRYYRVEEWRGTWKCTCPSTKTDCKHVRHVREVISAATNVEEHSSSSVNVNSPFGI